MIEETVTLIHGLLLNHLPVRSNKTPSGWITFDCPKCHDKRKRAGIIESGTKISFNCFNCGYKTGWTPGPYIGKKYKELAELLGADKTEIHNAQVELLKHSEELENADLDNYVYNFQKFETLELPDGAVPLENLPADHELNQYASKRKLNGIYPLFHFPGVLYGRRLVVPFFYNDQIVGWTGRHVNPPDKNTPKYYHNIPKGYVFNIDRFAGSERQLVIVTEGIFDAILIDGVSVLGNSVTPEQAHMIEKLGMRVIVCPDRDDAGKQLIDQAVALGWEVSFPPWADGIKDAADAVGRYGRLATIDSIINHATNNTIKIQVKSRML